VLSFLTPEESQMREGLPGEAIIGWITGAVKAGEELALVQENFRPNKAFVEFLHRAIAQFGPDCPGLQAAAQGQEEGWVYIIDGRTPSPQGTVPLEDILGAFEVADGRLVRGSYQGSRTHLLVSEHGLFILEAWLYEKMMQEIRLLPFRR